MALPFSLQKPSERKSESLGYKVYFFEYIVNDKLY